ncbi:MAG TPA: hypothetical protein VM513_36820 [Kofleriaceae bacterium]|nr:hypothetical protein [Kofleriaceae bacterium]
MFNLGLRRPWQHLEAAVREGRLHRWLVVPAVMSILIAFARGESPLWAIGLAPPLAVLPFVALASLAPTTSLVPPAGTAAINVVGWCAFVWSWAIAIFWLPYGALAAALTVPVLRATEGRPTRLAFIAIWLGAVGLVGMFPLAWLGVPPVELGVGSALLIAGGAIWMASAHLARPQEIELGLPRAVVAR